MSVSEDYCSFETAKLLKEKGFDSPVQCTYDEYGVVSTRWTEYSDEYTIRYWQTPCITHQLALKWLREIHSLHIVISIGSDSSTDADGNTIEEWYYWTYSIRYTIDGHIIYDNDSLLGTEYQSYEEAVESAIKYCLTNLI